MKKRQMRNGEITHLPFLCCGNKNQSFLSTPYRENLFAKTIEGNPMIDRAYEMVRAA